MIKRFSPTKVLFIRLIYHRSRNKTRIRGSGRNPTLGRLVSPQPHLLLAHELSPDLGLRMHQQHRREVKLLETHQGAGAGSKNSASFLPHRFTES